MSTSLVTEVSPVFYETVNTSSTPLNCSQIGRIVGRVGQRTCEEHQHGGILLVVTGVLCIVCSALIAGDSLLVNTRLLIMGGLLLSKSVLLLEDTWNGESVLEITVNLKEIFLLIQNSYCDVFNGKLPSCSHPAKGKTYFEPMK
uniref:Uncharacterized protein n=1 Tax=Glossina palpalis gambiensis TaxID=67801 RepID=A0A1B0BAQ8_9MUSC